MNKNKEQLWNSFLGDYREPSAGPSITSVPPDDFETAFRYYVEKGQRKRLRKSASKPSFTQGPPDDFEGAFNYFVAKGEHERRRQKAGFVPSSSSFTYPRPRRDFDSGFDY